MSKSPIEMIYDENCSDPIVMYNEEGEEVSFEQIALVPLDGEHYVILRPLIDYEGLAEDEALVFVITEYEGEEILEIVEDDETIDAVFEEYYAMLPEEGVV